MNKQIERDARNISTTVDELLDEIKRLEDLNTYLEEQLQASVQLNTTLEEQVLELKSILP